jgi:hypothetical protein
MDRILEYFGGVDPLALYGAATGSIGLVFGSIAAFNALFDRPFIRIKGYLQNLSGLNVQQVEVALINSGRRKAVCYPPYLRVFDRRARCFVSTVPAQFWMDGRGWVENGDFDSTRPSMPFALAEYESELYMFNVNSHQVPLWVSVTDSLRRTRSASIRLGKIRYICYRFAVALKRSKALSKANSLSA